MYVYLKHVFLQPEVLEQIQNLKELWMDNNSLQTLPGVCMYIHICTHELYNITELYNQYILEVQIIFLY